MTDTVPSAYAQTVIRLLAPAPARARALLDEFGLPPALLEARAATGVIGAEAFGRLFIALVRLSQEAVEGDAEAARQVTNLSTYRLMFAYMLQAADLADAIRRAGLFFQRFSDARRGFTLEVSGDTAHWRFELPAADTPEARATPWHFGMGKLEWLPGLHGRLAALWIWHRSASWLIGDLIDLDAVRIDLARPRSWAQAETAFRAPVRFGERVCELEFRARYLGFPLLRTEQDLNALLATFPAELLRLDATVKSTASRVRALLGSDFSRELPGLDEVASRLHMASATLHRRLQSEGTTFQKIKDLARREAAVALLRDGQLTGAEIADRLGFSDASSFVRAFRKWTGRTPAEFRRDGN